MAEVPFEPSQSEGAVDTAIRWMRSALQSSPPVKAAAVDGEVLAAIKTLAAIRDFCGEHRTDGKLNHVSALGVDAAIIRLEAILTKAHLSPGTAEEEK
jgi:hypothetical protein